MKLSERQHAARSGLWLHGEPRRLRTVTGLSATSNQVIHKMPKKLLA